MVRLAAPFAAAAALPLEPPAELCRVISWRALNDTQLELSLSHDVDLFSGLDPSFEAQISGDWYTPSDDLEHGIDDATLIITYPEPGDFLGWRVLTTPTKAIPRDSIWGVPQTS